MLFLIPVFFSQYLIIHKISFSPEDAQKLTECLTYSKDEKNFVTSLCMAKVHIVLILLVWILHNLLLRWTPIKHWSTLLPCPFSTWLRTTLDTCSTTNWTFSPNRDRWGLHLSVSVYMEYHSVQFLHCIAKCEVRLAVSTWWSTSSGITTTTRRSRTISTKLSAHQNRRFVLQIQ